MREGDQHFFPPFTCLRQNSQKHVGWTDLVCQEITFSGFSYWHRVGAFSLNVCSNMANSRLFFEAVLETVLIPRFPTVQSVQHNHKSTSSHLHREHRWDHSSDQHGLVLFGFALDVSGVNTFTWVNMQTLLTSWKEWAQSLLNSPSVWRLIQTPQQQACRRCDLG